MKINTLWQHQPDQCFWLEITNREDRGADLNAPEKREGDKD